MTDGLFSATELGTDARAGYRLHELELLNWGTFDQRIWRLNPAGDTSLLTGDIGSGKSTIVDAVTTLLMPAHRVAYNKAAGADAKERSLRSYVLGHYKSERNEATGSSRPIGLRDENSYSVILGVFVNDGYDETVTLAQVFHQRDRTGQPDRFFVTAPGRLTVSADFSDFGSDLNQLRRRLRRTGASVSTTFPEYFREFRRLLGIRSGQAMELFHQTVSMKSVGNLNDFVRSHMLEPVDAGDRIRSIVSHFEDLTKAHEAVRRAREQLEALEPLVAAADKFDEALRRRAQLEDRRDAVRLFFTERRIALLAEEIARDTQEQQQLGVEKESAERKRESVGAVRDELIAERAAAGGDRVGELERREAEAERESEQRRLRRERFTEQVAAAGLAAIGTETEFASLAPALTRQRAILEEERSRLEEQISSLVEQRGRLRTEAERTRVELASLAKRRNNLPVSHLDVRAQLCADLDLGTEELPFAGELIDVADEHEEWRGAAERVLRGFALSLIVPDEHYRDVSTWVNSRRLTYTRGDGTRRGLRLTYERMPRRRLPLQAHSDDGALHLSETLAVADGQFEDYLRDQLLRRAGHLCAEDLAEFQAADRAVTREGQVRSGDHHEKDDRSRVDDPTTWVLGWANERKIDALTQRLSEQDRQWQEVDDQLASASAERDANTTRAAALGQLEMYTSWSELDWQEAADRAAEAATERERLLAGSSRLAEIERQLEANTAQAAELDQQVAALGNRQYMLTAQIEAAERARDEDDRALAARPEAEVDRARGSYPDIESDLGSGAPTRSAACAEAERDLTASLTDRIERSTREQGGYQTQLVNSMNEVRRRWPEATTEMDANVAARGEFRAFRDRVATDDLPRFEEEFKQQLNTNTIRELAGFNSWLRRQAAEIGDRVARINEALDAVDFNPGRYIRLEAHPTVNQEIKAFRAELRAATDDTLSPENDHYSEQRFLDVRRIIERFQGREGHTESDKTWTRRVTDVRNWYSFSASERDRDGDTEWEHYRDSDGKSGGQKEKLAYTILAASLAYQFDLEWGVERSKDFRFAVIDEAFGRGSDASTRYALELFAKLGLQLLIVTPLQKVHVIEPYVQAIGFVDNPGGKYSRLQTLTIEEFRSRREILATAAS